MEQGRESTSSEITCGLLVNFVIKFYLLSNLNLIVTDAINRNLSILAQNVESTTALLNATGPIVIHNVQRTSSRSVLSTKLNLDNKNQICGVIQKCN